MSELIIKHKRTSNKIGELFDNLSEGEIGLVIDKGWIVFKGNDGEKYKLESKPIRYWLSGTTTDGSDYEIKINGDNSKITARSGELVKVDGVITTTVNMFSSIENLESVDMSNFDTSTVTSMSNMFGYCRSLASINLSGFDTSNVTSFWNMFNTCSSLTSLDLSSFDTSKARSVGGMFQFCRNLTYLDLSNFDTSNVNSMYGMFQFCPSTLQIKCKKAFRDWCIENKDEIKLPTQLQDANSEQWICIDCPTDTPSE